MAGRVALAIVALLLGACTGSRPDDGDLGRSPLSIVSSTTTIPTTTTSSPTTVAPTTSSTAPQATGVVLGPNGLGVADFGDEADQVVAELADLLGPPTDDRPLGSCPSGEVDRVVEFAELAVLIGDREGSARFVAWDLNLPSGALPDLKTAEGVGVGTTVAMVRASYGGGVEIIDDGFGPAFEVDVPAPGRLGGTLTATGLAGTVASLAGGRATCGE